MDCCTNHKLEGCSSSHCIRPSIKKARLFYTTGNQKFVPITLCDPLIIADDAQGLLRARATPAPGKLLSIHTADGPYGDRFWAQVAQGVRGRTAGECLDAYLAEQSSHIARFSVSGTGH